MNATKYIYLCLLNFLFFSCVNLHELIQQGDYETAFEISLRRLENGKVKTPDVDALSISYAMLQQDDKDRIGRLKASERPDIWPTVYEEGLEIKERQLKVQKTINRLTRAGINPDIELYPVDQLISEAREKSAIYFYAKAQQYILPAQKGDRQAARKAYYALKRCMEFLPKFKDASELRREMYDLGTTHVLLQTNLHEADEQLDARLFSTLLGGREFPMRYDWQKIHLLGDGDQVYHFQIDLFLDNYWVSGDELSSSTCTNTIEVKVGEKVTKEWSEKDSAYIEIVEDIYEQVSGGVTTYEQFKSGSLDLIVEWKSLEVEEAQTIQEILRGSSSWSNDYSEEFGDGRAADGCSSTIGSCWAYPSRYDMLKSSIGSVRGATFKLIAGPFD